jgi:hypothetical protein
MARVEGLERRNFFGASTSKARLAATYSYLLPKYTRGRAFVNRKIGRNRLGSRAPNAKNGQEGDPRSSRGVYRKDLSCSPCRSRGRLSVESQIIARSIRSVVRGPRDHAISPVPRCTP